MQVPCPQKRLKWNASTWSKWLLGLLLVVIFGLAWASMPTRAEAPPERPVALNPDDNCLMCHADPDFKGRFQNGELFSLYVDNGAYRIPVGVHVAGRFELCCLPH